MLDVGGGASPFARADWVAKAGYVEVPSRLQEQSWGVHGPWVGWSHHHWLIDCDGEEITFVFKPHVLHARASDHFPAGFHESLAPAQKVLSLWWTDHFRYRERVFLDADSLDAYLSKLVAEHRVRGSEPGGVRGRVWRALTGRSAMLRRR